MKARRPESVPVDGLTPEARLQTALQDLATQLEGIRTLVLGDRNGLPVATIQRGPKTLAATASATMVLAAAEGVASNLDLSPLQDVLLEGRDYKVIVNSLGGGFSLLAVVEGKVNLGMVKLAMARNTEEIVRLLGLMQ